MKFSVIVPVYNVERYLAKCLDSILTQSYDDYEIIVVNDGSPDNSQAIIDEYAAKYPEKIKAFKKENGGLSDARNFGIERASGDYLLFVDSDDYMAQNALKDIGREIDIHRPDVIGFEAVTVNEEGLRTGLWSRPVALSVTGEEAIIALVEHKESFEPAWSFAYRRSYWCEKGFEFMKGIYHEDFALMPLVILKAERVSLIKLEAYYYVSNDSSITRTQTEERRRKLAYDLLKGYDFLVQEFYKASVKNCYAGRLYLAYAANSVISRLKSLDGQLKKDYKKEIIKRGVSKNIIDDTLKRKIRKIIIRLKNGI
ncbi:MAG: glycosyltransferase [Clostridia bacterium]|nr:glycosyltransferase [Clostridia bacterium]